MRDGFKIHGIVRAYALSPALERHAGRGVPMLGPAARQAQAEENMRKVFEDHNLVVDQGLEAIAKFLGNNAGAPTVGGSTFGSLADITVASMELGTAVSPPEPVAGDTVGVGSLVYQPPITVSYPTAFSVMFSGVVPVGEANGVIITEEALRLANGKVFAKALLHWPKTSALALQVDHTITFSRS